MTSARRRGDGRGSRLYRLSRKGTVDLKNWLRLPLPDADCLVSMDPLRIRVRFLKAIPHNERIAMIQDACFKLEGHLSRATKMAKQDRQRGDTFRYLATRGGVLSIRAQLAWLREAVVLLEPGQS